MKNFNFSYSPTANWYADPTAPVLILFKAADLGGRSFQVKKVVTQKSLKQTKIWPNLTSKIISLIFRELSPRIIKNS